MLKRRSKAALDEAIIEYYKELDVEPTFHECFKRWSEEKLTLGFIEKQTFDRYETDYTHYLSEFGKKKVKTIDEESVFTDREMELLYAELDKEPESVL